MRQDIFPKGYPFTPFPAGRPSGALSAEDEFMRIHGGRGSRAVYAIVLWMEAGFGAAWRIPAALVMRTGQMRANSTGQPASPSAAGTAHGIDRKQDGGADPPSTEWQSI